MNTNTIEEAADFFIDIHQWKIYHKSECDEKMLSLFPTRYFKVEFANANQYQSQQPEITHYYVADNSDGFRDWLKQKKISFIPSGRFTSILIDHDIFSLGGEFALYKAKFQSQQPTVEPKENIEMPDIDQLIEKFLPNQFDLQTFKPKQILFLKAAFQQGAAVMFHELKNRAEDKEAALQP